MTFRIMKYKDLEQRAPSIITAGVSGWFKLEAIRPDGRVRPLTGWFPNLVLDNGLNSIGTTYQLSACQVGTSNIAPTVAQTGLQGYLAGTTTVMEGTNGQQTSAPYYGWARLRYRFGLGVATGNINEVGVGPGRLSSDPLWSRALTVDGGGSPTTITVLSDEILDVTYELRLYPPLSDGSGGPFNIGGTNYNVTWRAQDVDGNNAWRSFIGSAANFNPVGGQTHAVFSGNMGATILDNPSGVSSGSYMANNAYSNNSLQRDGYVDYGLDVGNVGGVKSTSIYTSMGAYQFEFDNPIPKDNTRTLNLQYRISWNRYP